jgi:hypothetical protein
MITPTIAIAMIIATTEGKKYISTADIGCIVGVGAVVVVSTTPNAVSAHELP